MGSGSLQRLISHDTVNGSPTYSATTSPSEQVTPFQLVQAVVATLFPAVGHADHAAFSSDRAPAARAHTDEEAHSGMQNHRGTHTDTKSFTRKHRDTCRRWSGSVVDGGWWVDGGGRLAHTHCYTAWHVMTRSIHSAALGPRGLAFCR